jgi:DNA-binding transcriptional LysR family regulator
MLRSGSFSWEGNLTRQRSRRKLAIPLEKLAADPLVVFSRKDYSEVYRILERAFAPIHAKPRIAVSCDSLSSLILEVEAGRGIALAPTMIKFVAGARLLYRPLTGTRATASVGIARVTNGDVIPAGEKFCEILRQISSEGEKPARRKQGLE